MELPAELVFVVVDSIVYVVLVDFIVDLIT